MVKKVLEIDKMMFIPIPRKMGEKAGIQPGSYVKVAEDGYRIIITPNVAPAEDYSEEELDKLDKLAKEKGGRLFKSGKSFLRYLEKISKK